MNSWVKTYVSDDPNATKLVGWIRSKDRRLFFGSIFTAATIYFLVWYSEEKEKRRRHFSIEKDIERERWRAEELGLPAPPEDDGFADEYLELEEEKRNKFSIFPKDKDRGLFK